MYTKLLKQLAIILLISVLGTFISTLLPIKVPGSVIGLLLVALFLLTGILKEEHIQDVGDFLLQNMSMLFVPLAIGLVGDFYLLEGQSIGFAIVLVTSLIVTFIGTYGTVRLIQSLQKNNQSISKGE